MERLNWSEGKVVLGAGTYHRYPDDDCIIVETLILNDNENIRSFHYSVL